MHSPICKSFFPKLARKFIQYGNIPVLLHHAVDFMIGQLSCHPYDAGAYLGTNDISRRPQPDQGAGRGPEFPCFQTAVILSQTLGKHGNPSVRHVNGTAPLHRLFVQQTSLFHKMPHIRNMNPKHIMILFFFQTQGIVKIKGGLTVNGDDGKPCQIFAARACLCFKKTDPGQRGSHDFFRKIRGNSVTVQINVFIRIPDTEFDKKPEKIFHVTDAGSCDHGPAQFPVGTFLFKQIAGLQNADPFLLFLCKHGQPGPGICIRQNFSDPVAPVFRNPLSSLLLPGFGCHLRDLLFCIGKKLILTEAEILSVRKKSPDHCGFMIFSGRIRETESRHGLQINPFLLRIQHFPQFPYIDPACESFSPGCPFFQEI